MEQTGAFAMNLCRAGEMDLTGMGWGVVPGVTRGSVRAL